MSNKILVAYATFTGSTAEIAEAIGKILAEGGASVDVRPMKEVTDLTPYRAVVLGSAIQKSQWLPEAMTFVQTYQKELAQKPTAIFLVCLTLAMKSKVAREKSKTTVVEWLKPVRDLIHPVSEGYFAGILNISKIPYWGARLGFRISVWTGVWSEGDHRDWSAIHTWAREVATKL
jgi:menaquinone-dependent protoporphyrinogen oxidase